MKIMIGKNQVTFLLNSGSVCAPKSLKKLATSIINDCKEAKWVSQKRQNIKKFLNEPLKTLGTLLARIQNNNWSTQNALFVIMNFGLRPLIGRHLFETMGTYIEHS